MPDTTIYTRNLTKVYPGVKAVDDLNLHVQRGEIYGFLGLNGAGKTTTIRALLGMIRPTAGSVVLLGEPVRSGGKGPWRRIGHLVEAPAAYPELTVRQNLEAARRLQQVQDTNAVDRVIEQLALTHYAHRKAAVLSSGNFQRLGLARALLHAPELLLLDEPASGLDPAGVVEIRQLLKHLASDEDVTVFMSSHILSEVDRLADRIGIIHEGRLLEEYDAATLDKLLSRHLYIQCSDPDRAAKVLAAAGHHLSREDDGLRLTDEDAMNAPDQIARLLVSENCPPRELVLRHEDLEDHFLRLIRGAK